MELQLSYDPQTTHKTGAAFLRGNSPEQWFREMSDWQISLRGLTCFLLPENKSTIVPGGLLVIFRDQIPAAGKISHPYCTINGKLYIPVNATLTPALSTTEMKELLIWDVQVFHPAIGFVGFNEDDKLSLNHFISAGQAIQKNWNHAHPGMPPLPLLQSISVDIPASTDLAGLLNDGESIRPLSELPGKKPRTSLLFHILDLLLKLLLIVVLGIVSVISRIWPHRFVKTIAADYTGSEGLGGTGSTASRSSENGKPATGAAASPSPQNGRPATIKSDGPIQRLRQWLVKTMMDLNERRESELNKLLKMFDKDGDEALKYAIPIGGGATAGRGTAPQSDTLGRKDTNFSLDKLFANGPVDTWSASDDFSIQLSRKYEQQAQKALEQGDYRKAAYIYAHLLGNLHKAAAVLEQGQFYHEAAALYRNRLNLPLKAAECFEKAGLLLDAINIYKELEKYEKTGDLYKQLSQDTAAEQYFRLAVDAALQQMNYLEAAYILQHKCGKPEEAGDVLLQGWHYDTKPITCLKQYFLLAKEIDENSLPDKIRKVYVNETPDHKKDPLIEALFDIRSHMNNAAQHMMTEVVYEIISSQIVAGNENKLTVLKKLLPDDKELPADIYRYTNRQKEAKQLKPADTINVSFQLDQHINWIAATVIKKQLLFVGTYENKLYVLRMTPQGDQKYYSWQYSALPENIGPKEQFSASFSENDATRYECKLLHLASAYRSLHLGKLILRSENPFGGRVVLDTTSYLPRQKAWTIGATITREEPVLIYIDQDTEELLMKGASLQSHYCTYREQDRILVSQPEYTSPLLGSGIYYFFVGSCIYQVGSTGRTSYTSFPEEIRHLAGIDTARGMLMMAAFSMGCALVLNYRDDVSMEYFAQDIIIRNGRFISDKYLLLIPFNHSPAIVYDVTTMKPVVKTYIKTAAPVLFILLTGNPGEVALVDEKGRISVHQID